MIDWYLFISKKNQWQTQMLKKRKRKKNEKHQNKLYTEIQSYKNEIIIGE